MSVVGNTETTMTLLILTEDVSRPHCSLEFDPSEGRVVIYGEGLQCVKATIVQLGFIQ